jgi:uncharacterized spore protein YtfJ
MRYVTSVLAAAAVLTLGGPALAQAPPQPAANPEPSAMELADTLVRQVGEDLRVKTVVGKSVTVGTVTLIPILMIDVDFGGALLVAPAASPAAAAKDAAAKKAAPPSTLAGADALLMSGEARPLGFVVVTRQGTRFISVTPTPTK